MVDRGIGGLLISGAKVFVISNLHRGKGISWPLSLESMKLMEALLY